MTPAEILDACAHARRPDGPTGILRDWVCRICAEAAIAVAVAAETQRCARLADEADAKMRAEYPALVKLAQARCHCIYSQVPEAATVLPALRTDYRCSLANGVAAAAEAAIAAAVAEEREACLAGLVAMSEGASAAKGDLDGAKVWGAGHAYKVKFLAGWIAAIHEVAAAIRARKP